MLTTKSEPWVRVAIYLVIIGLALEVAYRVYWNLNSRAKQLTVGPIPKSFMMAGAASLPLVTALVITFVFCRCIDDRSLADIGLRPGAKPALELGVGLIVAIASVAMIFLVGRLFGWFRIQSFNLGADRGVGIPVFCGGVTDFVAAPIFEEIMMRGYVFSVLYRALGAPIAVIGSSVLFSLAHLIKHSRLPLLYTINAFFFGVLVAHSRLITGALWAPIGIHMGWNFAFLLLGLPFAGQLCETGLITCSVEGPQFVTGGYYSPAAGLLGAVGLAVAASALTAFTPIF